MDWKQNSLYQITSDDNKPNDVDINDEKIRGDRERTAKQYPERTLSDEQIT